MIPYDRIMLGLSSCDVRSSITWPFNRFFLPSEKGVVGAFGNPATCQASGFLTQLSVSAWWYNCISNVYFLLTLLSQVKQKNFVEECELWMHLLIVPINEDNLKIELK